MAASYDFVQLDVFTRMPLAGNPLAIFTDARGLTDKQMQALAREMNLSETTFILPREVVTVAKIKPSGAIRLEDGRVLPPHYRQFLRGYAVASYGSQGKTVDHVLFSDSAIRAATNAQQWYVTILRGRKSIQIFTPDKQQLRQAILRSGERELALDLLSARANRHGVRRQILRSLRRGREFARRVFARAMRSWSSAIVNADLKPTDEIRTT